ncbi:MAG: hypothetical protein AAFY51_12605 [Pseudomonadota bacterium]
MRYSLKTDWLFYLFLASYAYLILNMTIRLWFGDGINIFATYSDAALPAQVILDANKVYWSKTCFLFGTLLLTGLGIDFRAAAGTAASFWSVSLIFMFGPSLNLVGALILGVALAALQMKRQELFATRGKKQPN